MVKPKPRRRRSSTTNVAKDVYGVVVEEDNQDSSTGVAYKILVGDTTYNIHPDSYNCNGVRKVYAKDNRGKWFQYDRVIIEDRRSMPKAYIPFRPDYSVKGNILNVNGTLYFKIRYCYNNNDETQCAQALVE